MIKKCIYYYLSIILFLIDILKDIPWELSYSSVSVETNFKLLLSKSLTTACAW